MKTIKLKWQEGKRWYRKYLTQKSIEEVKNLLISELGEELASILKVEEEGISIGWDCKKIGRQKSWVITKFKRLQEEFDFSIVSKKYLEFKKIFEQKKAWEQERKDREKVWSDFCKTVSVEWVTVWPDYQWRYSLKIDWHQVNMSVDSNDIIEKVWVDLKYLSMYDIDRLILSLQNIVEIRDRLRSEIIGKNISLSS